VTKSLKLPLWEHQYIYDAGHFLMVPMHYAFQVNEVQKIAEYEAHFSRFLTTYKDQTAANDKARMHYFYLISQYLSLKANLEPSMLADNLAAFLELQVKEYWLTRDAWHWSDTKFKGMKQRLDSKLSKKFAVQSPLYYQFIFDDEKFLFAIAADLASIDARRGRKPNLITTEILSYAERTYRSKVFFSNDGTWLMQPGVLSDHPDYAYAGYEDPKVHQKPKRNLQQAEDSSHSLRYPLWLKSLKRASEKNPSSFAFYDSLEVGLVRTIEMRVLKAPTRKAPYYHMTNFMDGQNGLYAWKNGTVSGGFNGYEPNQLSSSISLGWWAFLDSRKVNLAYRKIGSNWKFAYIGASNVDQHFITPTLLTLINRLAIRVSDAKTTDQ
jgi:hypothetical protein